MMQLRSSLLIFLSILFIATNTFSQSPPGYLGKKTTIGVGLGLPILEWNKAIDEDEFAAGDVSDFSSGRNTSLNIELNRTVNRYGSVSLIYSRATVGIDVSFFAELNSTITSFRDEITGLLNANITSISLMYNWHSKSRGFLAPIGVGWSMGLRHNSIKPSFVALDSSILGSSLDSFSIDQNISRVSFVVAWSRTILLGDFIYIKPRITSAANFRIIKTLSEFDPFFFGQEGYEQNLTEGLIYHEAIQILSLIHI